MKENRTHDWDKKEQAQARMRLQIKKVLRKYDYPPNKQPIAVEAVLMQAKLQCQNMWRQYLHFTVSFCNENLVFNIFPEKYPFL